MKRKISYKKPKTKTPVSHFKSGYFSFHQGLQKPEMTVYNYSIDEFYTSNANNLTDALAICSKHAGSKHWIHISGTGDEQMFNDICNRFDVHPSELDDVLIENQRSKFSEHPNYIFSIAHAINYNQEATMQSEAIATLLTKEYLVTIQKSKNNYFEKIISRMTNPKSSLRTFGLDYMAFNVNDQFIEANFKTIEIVGERLDRLEDEVLGRVNIATLQQIQATRRNLIFCRRIFFAERDKVNDIIRSHNNLVDAETKIYFKDSYDHIVQLIDLADNFKEITVSLTDIYLSSISNRMNEVMKTLAVISTIFLPLTFIVGLYGMNFNRYNETTKQIMPLSMPELYWPYGYVTIMAFMLALAIGMMLYFKKIGWLTRGT
ncbi:MAG: magnesium/cobalt transporter CorA [Bacteroidetes bacterium]|nr:magnesium/cobalt transporter CorA [Bacteroidota bacterium]